MRDILNRRQFLGAGAVVGASLPGPSRYLLHTTNLSSSSPSLPGLNTMWLRPRAASQHCGAGSDGAWETARLRREPLPKTAACLTPMISKYAAVLFLPPEISRRWGKTETRRCRTRQTVFTRRIRRRPRVVGVHAASDTFHTPPDPDEQLERYIAHGETIRSLFAPCSPAFSPRSLRLGGLERFFPVMPLAWSNVGLRAASVGKVFSEYQRAVTERTPSAAIGR